MEPIRHFYDLPLTPRGERCSCGRAKTECVVPRGDKAGNANIKASKGFGRGDSAGRQEFLAPLGVVARRSCAGALTGAAAAHVREIAVPSPRGAERSGERMARAH